MNANVLPRSTLVGPAAREAARPEAVTEVREWDPKRFASEQIRGLVQRVFFSNTGQPVRQVVFSAAGPGIDASAICDRVGQALALETSAEIAIVSRNPPGIELDQGQAYPWPSGGNSIKSRSWQIADNLWRVPECGLRELCPELGTERCWLWGLAELRNDFEYVVIDGPAAGVSSESALLAQLTDGIILVLAAHVTRKATAWRIKETLESTQCRILGTVLSERTFPVPAGIYCRL
jgi:hypothetical protein